MNESYGRLDLLKNILDNLIKFIEPYKRLLDTHNIQFIIDKHWSDEAIINEKLRNELENLIENEKQDINLIKIFETQAEQNGSLAFLFKQVKAFQAIWLDKVLTDVKFLFESHQLSEKMNEEFNEKFDTMKKQNRFMNQKKVYEVDTMSLFVAKLCNHLKIGTVYLNKSKFVSAKATKNLKINV